MSDFASVEDVKILGRKLTEEEEAKTKELLPIISDSLRFEAQKVGKDLDELIAHNPYMLNVARGVVVDIATRTLNTNPTDAPLTQMSQSAGGYTISGTYAIPGGGTLQILRNDLKKLGIRRQKIGVIDLYAYSRTDSYSGC